MPPYWDFFYPLCPYVMTCKKAFVVVVVVCKLCDVPTDKFQWSFSPSSESLPLGAKEAGKLPGIQERTSLFTPYQLYQYIKYISALFPILLSSLIFLWVTEANEDEICLCLLYITLHGHRFYLISYGKHSMFIFTVIGMWCLATQASFDFIQCPHIIF